MYPQESKNICMAEIYSRKQTIYLGVFLSILSPSHLLRTISDNWYSNVTLLLCTWCAPHKYDSRKISDLNSETCSYMPIFSFFEISASLFRRIL